MHAARRRCRNGKDAAMNPIARRLVAAGLPLVLKGEGL